MNINKSNIEQCFLTKNGPVIIRYKDKLGDRPDLICKINAMFPQNMDYEAALKIIGKLPNGTRIITSEGKEFVVDNQFDDTTMFSGWYENRRIVTHFSKLKRAKAVIDNGMAFSLYSDGGRSIGKLNKIIFK